VHTAYAIRSPLGSEESGVGCPRVVVGAAAQMASVSASAAGCSYRRACGLYRERVTLAATGVFVRNAVRLLNWGCASWAEVERQSGWLPASQPPFHTHATRAPRWRGWSLQAGSSLGSSSCVPSPPDAARFDCIQHQQQEPCLAAAWTSMTEEHPSHPACTPC
jgi:hypothetical protein